MHRRIQHIQLLVIILIIVFIGILFIGQLDWFLRLVYPLKYQEIIEENSSKYELDPYLVAAIIYVESKYNPQAVSHKGICSISWGK